MGVDKDWVQINPQTIFNLRDGIQDPFAVTAERTGAKTIGEKRFANNGNIEGNSILTHTLLGALRVEQGERSPRMTLGRPASPCEMAIRRTHTGVIHQVEMVYLKQLSDNMAQNFNHPSECPIKRS